MLSGDVVTVRIPELPEHAVLTGADRVPVWSAADNKTRQVALTSLREFIETGDTGTYTPVQTGAEILYIVPASGEGGDSVSIPGIAGMSFSIERDGYPLKVKSTPPGDPPTAEDEFEILSAGGFKLIGSTLIEGQRYKLNVFELSNGTVLPPSGVSAGSFIQGEVNVNTNISISTSDVNKLIQLRGGSNKLSVSIPDVNLCPEKSFYILEASVGNTKTHTITTTGGQYIYIEGQSKTTIYIAPGEYLWIYRTDLGWIAITHKGNFVNLGMPKATYKVGVNQLVCEGQLVNRADYPRLWEFVQSIGSSLVSESTWQTADATVAGRVVAFPYRGCFSQGNGSTTFRLPDLRGSALRGLLNYGSSDTQRHFNHPGGFQLNELASHDHDIQCEWNGSDGTPNAKHVGKNNSGEGTTNVTDTISIQSYGGTESRMDNIGVLWVIDY